MKNYLHASLRGRFSQVHAGFTLIEMAVVMVLVGIVISIIATVVPTLIRSAKIKQAQAILEKVDYAIQGYVTANGRLPFADNGVTGVEDSATPTYFGNLPFVTLGLSSGDDIWGNRIKYGVNSDLTTTNKTTMGTALGTACPDPVDPAKLNVERTGGGSANMAYVIVSGGPQDLDADGGFFDGLNSGADNPGYDGPDRIVTAAYDDLMIARSCFTVSGQQGYGIGTGTGGGGSSSGVENTGALCVDGIDNDSDGRIDCHDQDCCSTSVTVCPDGCPPPSSVSIVTTPAVLTATIGQLGFSHSFQATGGSGYYYWYMDAATPAISGLEIGLTSGILSGNVTVCDGDYNLDVRVEDRYDSEKTDSYTFRLTIARGSLAISPAPSGLGTPADFIVNASDFTQDFSVSGAYVGPFTSTSPSAWSIQWTEADPGGFQIDPVSDTVARLRKSGNASARVNPYPFKITAMDDSCLTNTITSGTYTIEITTAGAGAPYSANLVAEWHLDECLWNGTSGEVRDEGSLALDGTAMNGAITIGSGKNCRAGLFDGANDYVTVPNNAELQRTTAFSIASWVKVHADAADWVRLAGKGNSINRNYGLWLATNGTVLFQIYSDGGSGNAQTALTINDGNWHHVVGVYDLSTMKVYIDGTEKVSINYSQTPRTSTDPFTMGYAGFHTYLRGRLDEVMLFHKALTIEEITEIYQITRSACSGNCYDGPMAEYRMENFPWNGSANEVEDSGSGLSHGRALAWGTGVRPSQTTPSGGKICRSGVFNRTDANNGGYLDMGDPADGDLDPNTAPWTISAWIKWDGSSGENIIYNKENLYEARVSGGYVHYAWQPHWVWDGGNAFPITANTWTYVTLVYDGYQQSHYKNGSLVYSRTQTGTIGVNSAKLLIGARGNSSPYNFFGGQIDEIRIYDRALAENEIGIDYAVTRDCAADSVIITSTTLPAALIGQTNWTSGGEPTATGGATPYVWQIIDQEGGLNLSMSDIGTGALSGDIDVCAGVYHVTLRVTDNNGRMDETALPLTVANGTLAVSGLTSPLDCIVSGCEWPFSITGPIQGQMDNWVITWQGADPGGFEVIATGSNSATLRKTGASTQANGYRFYLTASDSSCGGNVLTSPAYTLNISAAAAPAP